MSNQNYGLDGIFGSDVDIEFYGGRITQTRGLLVENIKTNEIIVEDSGNFRDLRINQKESQLTTVTTTTDFSCRRPTSGASASAADETDEADEEHSENPGYEEASSSSAVARRGQQQAVGRPSATGLPVQTKNLLSLLSLSVAKDTEEHKARLAAARAALPAGSSNDGSRMITGVEGALGPTLGHPRTIPQMVQGRNTTTFGDTRTTTSQTSSGGPNCFTTTTRTSTSIMGMPVPAAPRMEITRIRPHTGQVDERIEERSYININSGQVSGVSYNSRRNTRTETQ